ncbi:type II toxin-antitoxin system toxin DNA ADP-ribosyl transferase DarT [Variovorax sp. R-27]|uniref:type II toxin-antitoxin system toxin DNA ADP-ribosyl transferase DarT n=1 Tax=Variovorax sp. R-27 TaxID=3404058 RepID=UPI003CF9281A
MAPDPAKTHIYHITDVANLAAIVAAGRLLSDAGLIAAGVKPASVAFSHIKDRRRSKRIPGAGNRTVHEFVPFYYCPRSPMLLTINSGNTGKPLGYQSRIVHLVSTVARGTALGKAWALTTMNAGTDYLTDFYHHTDDLERIDWELIASNSWPRRATEKSAEFLVADEFPWDQVIYIGCHNDAVRAEIEQILAGTAHSPRVVARPDWYY